MVLLFWPFMIGSIFLAIIGISLRKSSLLVVSFFLIIPFSLYIGATPLFTWWGFFLPLSYLGAALAIRKNKRGLSVLFILPVMLIIGWLGYLVITQ